MLIDRWIILGFNFPWYQFIIFPVLAAAAGLVVTEFIKHPAWEFNALLFFTVVSPVLYYLKINSVWADFIVPFRLLVVFLIIIPAALSVIRGGKVKPLLSALLVVIFLDSIYLSSKLEGNLNFIWPFLKQSTLNLGN